VKNINITLQQIYSATIPKIIRIGQVLQKTAQKILVCCASSVYSVHLSTHKLTKHVATTCKAQMTTSYSKCLDISGNTQHVLTCTWKIYRLCSLAEQSVCVHKKDKK